MPDRLPQPTQTIPFEDPHPAAALRILLEALGEGVVTSDRDGRITYANAVARGLLGLEPHGGDARRDSPRGARGASPLPAYELLPMDGRPASPGRDPLRHSSLDGGTVTEGRWRVRRPDGSELVVEGIATPMVDAAGQRLGAALVVRGVARVSTQERLQEALREAEEHARALEAASPVGVVHADLAANITYVSAGITAMTGVPAEALLGRGWTQLVHPEDLEPLLAGWTAASAEGRAGEHELRLVLPDGTVRTLHGRSAVVRDGAGAVVGSVATVEEVTERRRAAAALRTSEARLAGIIASATDAIITTDAGQRILLANAAAERLFGYRADELLGSPLDILIPERYRAAHREHVERFGATATRARAMGGPADGPVDGPIGGPMGAPGAERHVNLAALRHDGSEFPIEASISQVVTDEGRLYTVILRDITWRRQAEEERERLLAAERRAARSARLLQSLTAAFGEVLTPHEVVGVVLEQALSALGARTGLVALLNEERQALDVVGARGYAPEVLRPYLRIPLDEPVAVATVARTAEPVWLTGPENAIRRFPALAHAYATGGFQSTAALPMVDGRGRLLGVLAFNYVTPQSFDDDERALLTALARQCVQALERAQLFDDERTAREEAQRRRAEAEDANAAKSRFLAMTSHEIRTPINAILGYTELLEMGIPGPLTEEQGTHLKRIRRSSQHLLGLVSQVLDLSKIEADKLEVRPAPADAASAVAQAIALVEPQAMARGVAISNACEGASDVTYVGDPERLEQILVNLLTNGVKFTDAGGRVTVTCGQARVPAPEVDASGDGSHGWTYFRIEDTGIGVPEDRLGTIWEPFEQVDAGHTRVYGGTGLGLTISRRLARLMGGDITVRSEPGAGSTFFVWLPAAPDTAGPPEEAGRVGAEQAGLGRDGEADGDGAALREDGAARRRQRRGRARHARGLGQAADAVLSEIERVLSGYVARLRTDAGTPSAGPLSDEALENHAATLLADMAQSLAVIEAAQGAATLSMRDASTIQRVVAERHGAQRARLGWDESEVRRDFAILREELGAALLRRVADVPGVEVDLALRLLAGFLEHAERTSLRTFRSPPAPER